MIYENLLKQYEELTEEEKNTLLVYKSRLGRAINSLDNNDLEIKEIYEKSLIKVKEKLNEISKKIILTEDITVYRAFSISNEEELMPLSKANLVSTSLNINECSKYLIPNKDYTHYLYQINLEKGSMVTICPYRILIDNNDRLTLTKENGSEEIIISKDNYDFEEVMETTTEFTDNEELNIISVNAIFKVKDTKLKR